MNPLSPNAALDYEINKKTEELTDDDLSIFYQKVFDLIQSAGRDSMTELQSYYKRFQVYSSDIPEIGLIKTLLHIEISDNKSLREKRLKLENQILDSIRPKIATIRD